MKNFKTSEELVNMFSQKLEGLMHFKEKNYGDKILSIYEKWEKIISDEKIAANCELNDINNGIAIITVNHSGWSQQIFMKKKKILANFKKFYPELKVKNISVIVQSNFIQNTPPKIKSEYTPSVEEIREIEEFEKTYKKEKSIAPELENALKNLKKAVLQNNIKQLQ